MIFRSPRSRPPLEFLPIKALGTEQGTRTCHCTAYPSGKLAIR